MFRIFLKYFFIYMCLVLGGLGLSTSVFSQNLITKKKKVSVYEKATKKSSVIGTLKKGVSLIAKERKGMYWSVTTKGNKQGYVSITSVKVNKNSDDESLASVLRNSVQKIRSEDDPANIRTRSTIMGVRGLDESDELAFAGSTRPNVRLVYGMESYLVGADEIAAIEEGVHKEIDQILNRSKSSLKSKSKKKTSLP